MSIYEARQLNLGGMSSWQYLKIEVNEDKIVCRPHQEYSRSKQIQNMYELRISELTGLSIQENAPTGCLFKSKWRHVVLVQGQSLFGGASWYLRDINSARRLNDEISNAISKLDQATVNPVPANGIADEIGKLAQLRDEGVITQKEFEQGKERFLGLTTNAQETTANQLRQIHSLYKDGILSEGEFNMKKWDVLSKE